MINAVNAQFSRFVEFAAERVKAGKESAIARTGEVCAGEGAALAERVISATDKTDFVGMTFLRSKDAKAAAENGSAIAAKRPETSQGLSTKIAKNLKEKYELLNQYVVNYVEGAKLPKDIFSDAMRHFNMFAEDMRVLDYRINTLKDVSDKKIFEELFDKDASAYFRSCLLPIEMKIKGAKQYTPDVQVFFEHFYELCHELHEEHVAMRNACANAFAQNMLGSAKGKLIAAANEGGMATGTSSELPAVMLDKLGDFLAEDPYGNMEKVDKFCTYLENNGPAAFHVADGKNVDLNWVYREVIG